ncbi:uncharacterized protein LOC105690062 isoform X3 [Athalia rosae]|uniref:uncharacterized protein LOC105690062 isoform X3 n=1 Tax=Athalia rosae TaxID=37344 RepID=UPI002034661E|nr:uncharacterized protein LOC105690062 isoform X3 [Athalia rosae]
MVLQKCFVAIKLMTFIIFSVEWSEAFLTAPLPAYARGLASYDVTATTNDHRSRQINEVLQRIEDDEDSAIMKSNVNGRTVEERGGSIYVIEFESESNEFNDGSTNATTESIQVETHGPLDPWSIVWYIGSFGEDN